jgi:oligopeptide transport system substrate-binding protein
LAALALLVGCDRPGPGQPAAELRMSQRNEPTTLDPALATLPDDFFVIRALSEGLVAFDPGDGSGPPVVRPAAAADWNVSPDGLTWTFHLRPDGQWSNGEPVTAADFVASYRRLLSPATGAPKADLFFDVAGAEAFATGRLTDFAAVGLHAPSPLTLVVTLEHPSPRFLAYAASGPWIPVNPRTVARDGRDWTLPGHFVGNGPYRLTLWRPHQHIIAVRNRRYAQAGRVRVGALDFVAFDDGDTEERAFRSGGVDVTMAVPFTKLATYQRRHPDELRVTPMAETRYLAFNTARPPLHDVRVRRALSLALDRGQLARLGGYDPAVRLVPPALRESAPASAAATAGDDAAALLPGETAALSAGEPAEARRLLAAAGFPGGRNFPALELTAWSRSDILEAIQERWRKELGVSVRLVVREARVHLAALRAGNYDIGLVAAIPDVADASNLLQNFTTGAPANYPHWTDRAFDSALAAAARSTGPERTQALAAAEERLAREVPVAPLYYYAKHWLIRPSVHGWREDALWARYYLDLSIGPSAN